MVDRSNRAFQGRCSIFNDADFSHADIVINAASLGLNAEDPLPLDPNTLQTKQIVAEVIMKPDVTPLLIAAVGRGYRVHKGIHMLTNQAREIADFLSI